MAKPIELQTSFSRGMVQDLPREALPKDAVWNSVDLLPDFQEMLRKRGGWAWAASAFTTNSPNRIFGLYVGVFSNGTTKVLSWTTQASYSVTGNFYSALSAVGSGTACAGFTTHQGKVLMAKATGLSYPYYYDGTTFGSVTAGPPATFLTTYKDRTVAASFYGTNPSRVYFSAAADPLTWDLTNSWISVSNPITGLVALQNAILVFQLSRCSRIRGAIPPPGSDMILDDPIFNEGVTDTRAVGVWNQYCVFANFGGVYMTNGSSNLIDLTRIVGIKQYWQDMMAPLISSATLAPYITLGIYGNFCFVTVLQLTASTGAAAHQDGFMFDLDRRTVVRLGNVPFYQYAPQASIAGAELYAGHASTARIAKVSTFFTPSATYKNDGDGTAVAPILETGYYLDTSSGKKTWRAVYPRYDLRDAAADNPTFTVSVLKDAQGAYTALSPILAETTQTTYTRLPLRFPSDGIALKIQQANASSETRIVSLAADVHVRERSRVS